ncbi:MAG: mechanosensitive ion channel domain-containing protein [Flavobacteriales bacterium]
MDISTLGISTWKNDLELLFQRWGASEVLADWLALVLFAGLLFTALGLLSKLLARVFTEGLKRFSISTHSQLDDHLLDLHVPRYVARFIPLMIGYRAIPWLLHELPELIEGTQRIFNIFFIVLLVRIFRAILLAGRDTLNDLPSYRDKPLNSYVQVGSIVMYIIAGVLIFSLVTGKSVIAFLTAMGAASAILLLIFKDSILGFVASIQISANDMVRQGDWITMPKYGADGNVTEINLTTVKVANFDRTITTIPTYALIADSFQNWRGMEESGGRRIKRSILIKVSSIRFLHSEEIDALRSIALLAPYIDERKAEIATYNSERSVDESMPVNGRRMTNAGLYRKYIDLYLAQHPSVHQHMTRMVRQLPPNEHGLPLELYCFSNTTEWVRYEGVISDIFDHLLAAHRYFKLVVFENPAADDMRNIGRPGSDLLQQASAEY